MVTVEVVATMMMMKVIATACEIGWRQGVERDDLRFLAVFYDTWPTAQSIGQLCWLTAQPVSQLTGRLKVMKWVRLREFNLLTN